MSSDLNEFVSSLSEDDKTKLLGLLSGARPKTGTGEELPPSGAEAPRASRPDVSHETKLLKLPKFSGNQSIKSEPSFRVWKFEVDNLKNNFGENEVKRAIHHSVTGPAAEILVRLGQTASVTDILAKYDNIFGVVASSEKLLADFYTAQQKSNEKVAEWACRLEEILSHPKLANLGDNKAMLKSRFFFGLSSDTLRNAVRHRFESATYDQLLVYTREAEEEMKSQSVKSVSAKPQVVDPVLQQLEEIQKNLKLLTSKTEDWEKRLSKVEHRTPQHRGLQPSRSNEGSNHKGRTDKQGQGQPDQKRFVCYFCKSPGHIKRNCTKYLKAQESAVRGDK